jgi:uncharacterized phage protein (TIGR02218 family)
MTTRPGHAALDLLRYTRVKTLAHCIRIIRSGEADILVTDHDRRITFDGRTYSPTLFGDLSADRREGGLRSGNQEARGPIDGTTIVLPDLIANRYRGAEVEMAVIDWTRPWVVFARHRKWIRKVVWTGSQWVATIEGRTQQLSRPTAGRFGGTFSTFCPYTLGDTYCRKDISDWTQWGLFGTNGTSTSAGYDTLTDSGASWTVNQWAGFQLFTYGGATGSGQQIEILSNTATTIKLVRSWDVQPGVVGYVIGKGPEVATVIDDRREVEFDVPDFYFGPLIAVDGAYRDGSIQWTTGDNIGTISNIVRYVGATRRCELLLPTPFPIQAGDRGVVTIGCDGLLSTCRDKFANVLNFGGDAYAPSAQAIIEPPEEV